MDLLIPEFDFAIIFHSFVIAQLFGFACWNVLMLFIRKTLFLARLDNVIMVLTMSIGVLSLLLDVYTLARDYFSSSEYNQYSITSVMLSYWHYLLWKTIVVVLASQSLWFRYVRNSTWLRLIASLLIFFFLFFEKVVILVTSLHRDYLPFGWETTQSLLSSYLQLFISFVSLTAIGYLLRLYKIIDNNEYTKPI